MNSLRNEARDRIATAIDSFYEEKIRDGSTREDILRAIMENTFFPVARLAVAGLPITVLPKAKQAMMRAFEIPLDEAIARRD